MPDIVIADTSCLVVLEKIGQLDLLRSCYDHILITFEIALEFGLPIPPWITIKIPANKSFQKNLMQKIGLGESSALALAYENPNATLILDDLKARKEAMSHNLKITGTLGIIVNAKKKGVIPSVSPILDQLRKTDFRISKAIIDKIKEIAGE